MPDESGAVLRQPVMPTRNVTQSKAEFYAPIKAVEQGEEVTITRHGEPIARLIPLGTSGAIEGLVARRRQRRILKLQGVIDIDPDFDYKKQRSRA